MEAAEASIVVAVAPAAVIVINSIGNLSSNTSSIRFGAEWASLNADEGKRLSVDLYCKKHIGEVRVRGRTHQHS